MWGIKEKRETNKIPFSASKMGNGVGIKSLSVLDFALGTIL